MKYKKKPVIIEAVQFTGTVESLLRLSEFINDQEVRVSYEEVKNPKLFIQTLEGEMQASVGDYIIKGIQGEFYPCKPDIFEQTYEKAGEQE